MNRGADRENGSSQRGSPPRPRRLRLSAPLFLLAALALSLATGCASSRPHVDKGLLADRGAPERNEGVAEQYLLGCPDALDITVAGRPELNQHCTVGPDGRIDLGELGKPRVEGHTGPEVVRLLADKLSLPPEYVDVRVAAFHSECLYLFGEVHGLQRAVSYRGQETVLDLLQRVGGITTGAAPDDVYVIRSRIAEGQRPEVFHVDLRAIVMNRDQRTNVRLQPFDQVHVGASRRARLEKCVPPWLRPLFRAVCGWLPTPHAEHPEAVKPHDGMGR